MLKKPALMTASVAAILSYTVAFLFTHFKETIPADAIPGETPGLTNRNTPVQIPNAFEMAIRENANWLNLLEARPDLLESMTFDSAFDKLSEDDQRKLTYELLEKWPRSRAAYVSLTRLVGHSSSSECAALFNDPLVQQQWLKNKADARREPSVLSLLAGKMDDEELLKLSALPTTDGWAIPEFINVLSKRNNLQLVTEVWKSANESKEKREQISRGILRAMLGNVDDLDKLTEITRFASSLDGFQWKEAAFHEVSDGLSTAKILQNSALSAELPPALKSSLVSNFLDDSPEEALMWAASQSDDGDYGATMTKIIGKAAWDRFLINPKVGFSVATLGQDVLEKLSTKQKEIMWQSIFRKSGWSALQTVELHGRAELNSALSAAQNNSPEAIDLYGKIPTGSGPAFLSKLAETHLAEARNIILGIGSLDSQDAKDILFSSSQSLNPEQMAEMSVAIFSKLPANKIQEVAFQTAPVLGRVLGSQGPTAESADRLLTSIPTIAQARTVEALVQSWAGQDPMEAAAWLNSLPAGENKRNGARALLPHIANDSEAWNAWNEIANPAAQTPVAP